MLILQSIFSAGKRAYQMIIKFSSCPASKKTAGEQYSGHLYGLFRLPEYYSLPVSVFRNDKPKKYF